MLSVVYHIYLYIFMSGVSGFSQLLQLLASPNLRRHLFTVGFLSGKHPVRISCDGQLKVWPISVLGDDVSFHSVIKTKVLNVHTKSEYLYRILWRHKLFFSLHVHSRSNFDGYHSWGESTVSKRVWKGWSVATDRLGVFAQACERGDHVIVWVKEEIVIYCRGQLKWCLS